MDDLAIRNLVARLSRPHPSGGKVIERAAILASGHDASAILTWIAEHGGEPEDRIPITSGRGLHSARLDDGAGADQRAPLRFVLPADSLTQP